MGCRAYGAQLGQSLRQEKESDMEIQKLIGCIS